MNSRKKTEVATPIAIIGIAFRFPGEISDEESFWQALKDGRDVVGSIGKSRWASDQLLHPNRAEPGRSVSFSAGTLSRIEEFDAQFFGISPREAAWLDPQQRLLLELSWEAMENAGQVPQRLAGSDCAVYVGISSLDYGMRGLDDLSSMSAHSMTGNTHSIASNRLSYFFDLRGPSMSVDTACSSSLVALHLACRALQAGESATALVGGVNLLLHPYSFVGFTKASMLSANGRCRAFDAAGDGYVRSEGAAVLLLKPLQQAEADGDPIHAVIRATATNADGGRKTGITIPSAEGQSELLEQILRQAGVAPEDIDYVEAHGTGTAIGDPVEAAAIGRVLGQHRPMGERLPIGSVKTNLGHMEPASGMAGLVKTLLALKHRALPPSLHLQNPNPNIDFDALNLEVVTAYRPLPKNRKKPLRMGVNSFGFGGANAHVLLEEYRGRDRSAGAKPKRENLGEAPPLVLSARTPQALRELAAAYAGLLQNQPESAYYDIAYSATYRRQLLDCRMALAVATPKEAVGLLQSYAQGEFPASVIEAQALPESGGVAFIYSGNGTQWLGMGCRLLAESPRFAQLLTELDALIRPEASFSILDELGATPEASRLDDTAVAQPLVFALQIALTRLLREQGIQPDAVAGHSVGEVAAAWTAGALTLQQAIQVICRRSAAQARTRDAGRMLAVGLSEAAVRELLLAEALEDVEIAGINSPANVTLSGPRGDIESLANICKQKGVFYRRLDFEYAFHSRFMDSIQQGLLESLAGLAPTPGDLAFVSGVTGDVLEGRGLVASYWWDNVRQPVQFAQAVSTLIDRGNRVFVEIGPHAILQRYLSEGLAAKNIKGQAVALLRREDDGLARLHQAVLRVHLLASQPHFEAYFPISGRFVRLPNYPWQRERHWHPQTSEAASLIHRHRVHPLLGWRLKDAEAAWENTLDTARYPYLTDHQVGGAVVLPGSAYAEMVLAAAAEWHGGTQFELEELNILSPVIFDAEHARALRFDLSPRDGSFRIRSRQRLSDDAWVLNAAGRLLGAPSVAAPPLDAWVVKGKTQTLAHARHYQLAARLGLDYGPAFRGLESICVQENALSGQVALPAVVQETLASYFLHPALLDLCFQSLIDFFQDEIESGQGMPLLPVKIGRLRYFGAGPVTGFRARLLQRSHRSVVAEFALLDADGKAVAVLEDCRFRAAVLKWQAAAEPATWRIETKLVPHAAEQRLVELPSAQRLVAVTRQWLAEREDALGRGKYFMDVLPILDATVVSFAFGAFRWLFEHRRDWVQAALASPEIVAAETRMLFRWLTRCLQQESLLVEADGRWRLNEADALPPAEEIWRTVLGECPACLPDLVFIGRIGERLPALLGGEGDAEQLAHAIRHSHLLEQLYDESPSYSAMNHALAAIVRTLSGDWPEHRRLRVLEISGGYSGMPGRLASELPAGRCDYVIAQALGDALVRLSAEYDGHPFVSVATLASEEIALEAENRIPEHFDVVIVHHWLHRVKDLSATLNGLRGKLATGGVLLLAERHPDLAADFCAGLESSWWHESDGAPASSLLTPAAWDRLLTRQGFAGVEVLREPAAAEVAAGTYLLLAKNTDSREPALPEPAPASWLLLCDVAGASRTLAARLAHLLESQGQRAVLAFANGARASDRPHTFSPTQPESVRAMLSEAREALQGVDHIVHLAGLLDEVESAPADPMQIADVRCLTTLHLLDAIEVNGAAQPRLWLVTMGGALSDMAGDRGVNPLQGALWGMGRVVMNEYPGLSCTLIDLQIDPAGADAVNRLQNELLAPDGEAEIVLASQGRFGLRMRRESSAPDAAGRKQTRYRLDFGVPGQLRNLAWHAAPERALEVDEVEVTPAAVGLNFRDVMYAMGLLPDEAVENGFSGASLGLEFAGTVTRVGEAVSEFEIGDAVMGFGPACFASHVQTRSNALTKKPSAWTFEEAATVPTVFFTVYYALKHLADLQPGERVLIHGAAGGVGIAAFQVARYLEAEIFATAGSDEKRDFVTLMGADHVLDSRSLAFADDILALTEGEGVDVVLNSLAGEAINRNLRVLKPFGRFLELGKRDFFENTHIGLRPFKDNISYFGIDADQLLMARPKLAARIFREVMALFEEGALRPLPYRAFPAGRVVEAFRYMQQARQIGKVVVNLQDQTVDIASPPSQALPLQLESQATYLVTGGLSGFGFESSRWLVERGARHVVLLGRRGAETPGAEEAVAALEALGAQVRVFACDVTDAASLQSVLKVIERDLPPLRGVLHAAMVLDDALLRNLDAERMRKVLAPKLLGAWNLHILTLDKPLNHFILYSSVTTFIGNPGQANYVAANAYLEALAATRRASGLPATCVAWGPIGDAGYLARNTAIKDGLAARLGGAPLTSRQALAALERMLCNNESALAVADFSWPALERLLPSAQAARFEYPRAAAGRGGAAAEAPEDIRSLIDGRSPEEVRRIVQEMVALEVGQILCIPADRIDPARSLYDFGLDSLMAVELALGIEKRFGINMSAMALNEGPTLDRIGERLAAQLCGPDAQEPDAQNAGEHHEDTLSALVGAMAVQHAEAVTAADIAQTVEDVKQQIHGGAG